MKKLLVVALSVVMVLAFAAVSMAAVTVSGEVNFGYNLTGPATVDDPLTLDVNEAGDFVASDFGQGDAKVAFTAALNDEVSAFVALKTAGVDEAWAKFTEDFGTIKVGYFGWSPKQYVDILNPIQGGAELKTDANINGEFTVAEGVTATVDLQRKTDKMDMGFKVGYTADSFGASVGYLKFDASDDAAIVLNGSYNLTPAVVYLSYCSIGSDYTDAVLGASYDSDSIYARAEFEVVQPDGDKTDADTAFRVGYKLGNGAKLEYNTKTVDGADAVSSIKVNVAF